jgi:alkanesulfonate monooxygenase SsuD/methylene tetrahydromethanopterin reductase-like flavin-dependent oxidoreductase (luciferase family)
MMVVKKQILLNAFNMNCVGHINHGFWTHPRDRSPDYNTLAYWTDQAKLLERGLFDGMFIADIIGVYDVYGGGIDVTARESVQLPVNDPILLVSAMAAATENLGFGITVNVHNEAPYTLARRFSTLDHLTRGRIGWNIVTGYLESAHRGKGDGQLPEHDRRYDYADEYLEVLYKLWDFIDIVIPELQDRGLYKTAYADGSLRQKLFGQGDRLPGRHAAGVFRPQIRQAEEV